MNQFVYEINNGNYDSTLVENIFINEYMPTASGDHVKVYLYCLMQAKSPKPKTVNFEDIAKNLMLTTEEVFAAIKYWEKMGIMSMSGVGLNRTITCHNIIEVYAGKNNGSKYTTDSFEIEDTLNQILFHVEKMLKAPPPLSYMQAFESWLTEYHFEPDTIILLVESGLENMKGTPSSATILKYISKIAADWYQNGIRTKMEAQDYLKKHKYENKLMYKVIKSLGIYNRGPMENERRIMRSWFDDLHFEETMILEAVGRSRVANVQYVDGILKRWFKNGWKTPTDIVDEIPAKKTAAASKPQANLPPVSKERIAAVEEAESDFLEIYGDEIAELAALDSQEAGESNS